VSLPAGDVRLTQTTAYPWDGRVTFSLEADDPTTFTLRLRRPAWLDDGPFGTDPYRFSGAVREPVVLTVNGESVPATRTAAGG
jgi:hypothetical protein